MTLLMLLIASVHGQAAPLTGEPPLTRLVPDIDHFPQFFTAVEDSQGQLLVGGVEELLSFDGARWRSLPIDLQAIRSLWTSGSRTYVGAFGRIGYLEPSASGQLIFTDLTAQATANMDDPAFKDIWDIFEDADGRIYFKALRDLFVFDPSGDNFSHLHHAGRFGAIFAHAGEVWLQFRGEGFRAWRDGQWRPLPRTSSYTELVFDAASRADGSLLGIAFDGKWMQLSDSSHTDYDSLLGPASGYNSIQPLDDGGIMLGTTTGELVYLADDNSVRRFDIAQDWIADVGVTATGWLLVTMSGGELIALDWPPRWSVVGKESALRGSVYGVRQLHGRTFILSSSGIFEAIARDAATDLSQLPWTQYEAWDLVKHGADMIFAESYRLLAITDEGTFPLSDTDLYPRVLWPSSRNPDWLWVGTETGLAVMGPDRNVRHLGLEDYSVVDIVEAGSGDLWIAAAAGGVFRITMAPDFQSMENIREKSPPGTRSGGGSAATLQQIHDVLLASTADGIFEYVDDHWRPTALDGLSTLLEPGERVRLRHAPDGTLWAVSDTHIRHRPVDSKSWQQLPTGAVRNGVFQSVDFPFSSSPYFGTSQTLVRYHPSRQGSVPGHQLRITRISRTSSSGATTALDLDMDHEFVAGNDSIAFSYALLDLADPAAVRYKARLNGYESRFTEWETTATYYYAGLAPGEYQFEVRARDSYGELHSTQGPHIKITPRWYESWWFRIFAIAVLAGLSFLLGLMLMARRHRRMHRRNEELAAAVSVRTDDLARANRRLEILANQDGLTGLANRRQFDAFIAKALSADDTSLIMVDIDHFKQFNDAQGHLKGDELLQQFADYLGEQAPVLAADHLVARYGGEEFAVILPRTAPDDALTIARELKARWCREPTISMGVAHARKGDSSETLIAEADAALYAAKSAGRDKIRSV